MSHQHILDHLLELVETTLNDLINSKCIVIGMNPYIFVWDISSSLLYRG